MNVTSSSSVALQHTYETSPQRHAPLAPTGEMLMPDPVDVLASSGDLGAQMAALVVQTGRAQRKAADAVRASEEALQLRAEQEEIASLHREAGAMRSGAWVSGGMAIGGAALGGVGETVNLGAAEAAGHLTKSAVGIGFESGGKLLGGLKDPMNGLSQAMVKDLQAQTKQAEHRAAHARSAVGDTQQQIDDQKKLLDKASAFYAEYLAARDQTLLVAARRA